MQLTFKFYSFFIIAFVLLTFSSCGDDPVEDTTVDPNENEIIADVTGITIQDSDLFNLRVTTKNGADVIRLSGNINRNITLSPLDGYEWLVAGALFVVPDGSTTTVLSIDAGTTLYFDADAAQASYLSIAQDAQIDAEGAVGARILLTSSNDMEGATTMARGGDWGGLIVNGRAQINVGETAEGEGGSGTYGGNNDADSSGTIAYVVLKYAGRAIGVDNELNAFSFNGVGSGTTIHHIQSYLGEDDGIEFFGGAANVKYAISTGSKDDSFDWTHGWRGKGQFWVVEQIAGRGDRGIEADNLEDDHLVEPASNPTLSNLTFIGTEGSDDATTGINLRRGTKGAIHNALVTGFVSRGIRITDVETIDNVTNGTLTVTHSTAFGNGTNWDEGAASLATLNSNMSSSAGITLDGVVGVYSTFSVDPTTVYGTDFFESVNYQGAVDPANNWMTDWALDANGNDL